LYHSSSQLAAAIVAGIADPNFKARLLTLGVEADPFGQFIADEIAKWPKVIKLPTSSWSDPSQHSVTSDERIPQRNVAFGSNCDIVECRRHVGFAPMSGHHRGSINVADGP
jgi:hypothetical protein